MPYHHKPLSLIEITLINKNKKINKSVNTCWQLQADLFIQ